MLMPVFGKHGIEAQQMGKTQKRTSGFRNSMKNITFVPN